MSRKCTVGLLKLCDVDACTLFSIQHAVACMEVGIDL